MSMNIRMFYEAVNGGDYPCKRILEVLNPLGEMENGERYKFQIVKNNPNPPMKEYQ